MADPAASSSLRKVSLSAPSSTTNIIIEKANSLDQSISSPSLGALNRLQLPSTPNLLSPTSASQLSLDTSRQSETATRCSSGSQVQNSQIDTSGPDSSQTDVHRHIVPDVQRVTITVTISEAIPKATEKPKKLEVNENRPPTAHTMTTQASTPQQFLHCEYKLLPDDPDSVKMDVISFGVVAKIFVERQEPKVIKTWTDGDQEWAAWSHCHSIIVTDEVLMKLLNHTVVLRIWDTRDRLSGRAKFDRPKAFRFPQTKPGEDEENMGGVKSLVLKQSDNFQNMNPKGCSIDRPLPLQLQVKSSSGRTSPVESDPIVPGSSHRNFDKDSKRKSLNKKRDMLKSPTQDGHPLKSYRHLVDLAGVESEEFEPCMNSAKTRKQQTSHGENKPSRTNLHVDNPKKQANNRISKATSKTRRGKKGDSAANKLAEEIKKNGVTSIVIPMTPMFAGLEALTHRLDKPLPTLADMFVTISLDKPLMSEEQKQRLNPLIIKVHGVTEMPNTPISYADLRLKCQPAYIKYKFCNQLEHRSYGQPQGSSIYWDDINVIFAGILDPAVLSEYLNGPLLEIEVHDRDRTIQKPTIKPTLFGDDIEDQKISNVGTVTSKRTSFNPFAPRDQPWDPYGRASFNLSGLLSGESVMFLSSPIHAYPVPDLLGTQKEGSTEKLVGVAGATDGPTDSPLPMGHYIQANSMLKIRVQISKPLLTHPQIANKEVLVGNNDECPFSRIIFKFKYTNVRKLHHLYELILQINSHALLSGLPAYLIEPALSTYKLSAEQHQSHTLDIVTGFQVMDGTVHLFVLEGLKDGAIVKLWQSLPVAESTGQLAQRLEKDMEVLFNSDLTFHERLYGALDVDLVRIKLHEPLDIIMQQSLVYVRYMLPYPCFGALSRLHQLKQAKKMREVVRNNLFPTVPMMISLSREFGVPVTITDFEEFQGKKTATDSPNAFPVHLTDLTKTSRPWTPIDNANPDWDNRLHYRDLGRPLNNFIKGNKVHTRATAIRTLLLRMRSRYRTRMCY